MEEELEHARRAFHDIPSDATEPVSDDEEGQRSMLLARKVSKQVVYEVEADHERAVKEWERQAAYLRRRDKPNEAQMEQFFGDQKELGQIKAEEKRLQAVKMQAAVESEEARQCEIGIEVLKDQKNALWERLAEKLAERKRQQQSEEGEEESRVEITMETSMMETSELDYSTVVEQGKLLAAVQPVEDKVYKCLVKLELNDIQWRYEALSYLTSILQVNKEAHNSGDET